MKRQKKDQLQVFGQYLIEYRNERGDLFFYKREKVNDVNKAMSVKDKLEKQGFSDIRIINKSALVN